MFVHRPWIAGERSLLLSRRQALGCGAAAMSMVLAPRAGHASTLPGQWIRNSGRGNDIGVGFNGTRVLVGAGAEGPGGWPIYRQATSGAWALAAGQGVRIASDRGGNIWVITASGQIFFGTFNSGTGLYQYQAIPAPAGDTGARDVGVGWDSGGVNFSGTIWIVGLTTAGGGGGRIYKFNNSLTTPGWTPITGTANRITADNLGNPWVTTLGFEIFQFDQVASAWTLVPGSASDIGFGLGVSPPNPPAPLIWAIGSAPQPGGGSLIYQNNNPGVPGTPVWQQAPGQALNIAGARSGQAWVTTATNLIFHFVPA